MKKLSLLIVPIAAMLLTACEKKRRYKKDRTLYRPNL